MLYVACCLFLVLLVVEWSPFVICCLLFVVAVVGVRCSLSFVGCMIYVVHRLFLFLLVV